MSDSTLLEEIQTKAVADLSSLGRVSHKLALTEAGPPLEKVLQLLLPRLLVRVGTNNALAQQYSRNTQLKDTFGKIHSKLVEIMSHILQRVRADPQCQLPCLAVLELLYDKETYTSKEVDVFTMNLTLTFLNLGVSRCTSAESLLPGLLVLLATFDTANSSLKSQSNQVAHLLLQVMQRMVTENKVSMHVSSRPQSTTTLAGNKETDAKNTNDNRANVMEEARRLCRDNGKIASSLFDLLLDVILYQPSNSKNMPPPGLSQAGHERLLSNKEWSSAMTTPSRLKDAKIAILNFVIPSRQWALFMNGTDKGIARTVALLVAVTGDLHQDVVERATIPLKSHLDTMRERNEVTHATAALGDSMALSCTLLSLVLGESNAESALLQIDGVNSDSLCLGRCTPLNASQQYSSQVILSLKRRMVSDQTAAAIMSFVSKILEENPQLLDTVGPARTRALATLAVLSASKLLSTTGTSALSTLRATPYIAAAQLLNALAIRLVSLETPPVDILAKSLTTVCTVLTQAATRRPAATSGTFEGSIAMRDACYGVVCALSRSRHAESFIFACGRLDANGSLDTAKLLFGCAANEEETLRPRAVAALDALLGAYCRVYATPTQEEEQETCFMEVDEKESNPWAVPTVSDSKLQLTSGDTVMNDGEGLARALLPLLWSGAQSTQPKASRVAAARWSSELLKTLDLPNACHILCFLAGDKDVTAASIAREGLGMDKMIGEPYDEHANGSGTLPDFSDLALVLFSDTSKSQSTSWRPRYFDFSYHGKAAALRFGLICLHSDLYGGEDDAVCAYVNALSETIMHFGTAKGGRGSAHGRESIDLLDECSICLAGCISTSSFARFMILSGRLSFGLEEMEALAILADSSKARRYLAEACGHIYEDQNLWQSAPGVNVGLDEWMEKCQIQRPLEICAKKLAEMQTNVFDLGEVHGAAFLGARCCRAFRLMASKKEVPANSSIDSSCWESIAKIIEALGCGTVHSDEVMGNAFSQGLSIALSYKGVDAPILDPRVYTGTTSALTFLNVALRKYSNGDHTDATRTSALAHAAGLVLASSTSAAGYVSDGSKGNRSVGPARIQCVDALFTLIGSNAFRKDPEVALVAGEALADYADAYGPKCVVWSSVAMDWPDTYSDEYANELPPHQQVSTAEVGTTMLCPLSVFTQFCIYLCSADLVCSSEKGDKRVEST